MDANRFDTITKLFATRRTRRQAVATGGVGIAATGLLAGGLGRAAAQDATPAASPAAVPVAGYELGSYEKTTYLFVQSFQSGSLTANPDVDRYTLSLDAGLGKTIYFGDRPSRDIGTTPTNRFLDALGFSEDNPPNAALLVNTEPVETEIAVLQPFAPTYDLATRAATYQVRGLDAWEDTLDLGFQQGPTDLSGISPAFSDAYLPIDDCLDGEVD